LSLPFRVYSVESSHVFPDHDIEQLAGVQILANLDSKWTPADFFRDVEERKHFRKSMFYWGLFWWTW